MEKIFQLNGWGRYTTPILSWQLTKLSYNDFPYSVIFKRDYLEIFTKEDIFETLKLTSGNIVAVGYKIKTASSYFHANHGLDLETVPAIYFSKKSDIVMFKLAYSEIISECIDGDEKPGLSTINIDIEQLKERINSDKHPSKNRWKY